ncbi:NlpC/P60 family protein [Vibrio sp. TH_r3]|uniref:C40 family peptidase n=1 Tax=Vibrio sp. TH_r3 TaxID=3082084 RepID=UPI002952E9B2|nr:NlpC/P60 family protein [Vibrio sp. TH_r3]MDV7104401.1 NlpC/P60 family protein [Vibrio sp. TH_r3]
MKKTLKISTLISAMLLLSACTSNKAINTSPKQNDSKSAHSILHQSDNIVFVDPFKTWQGTPYKYGGASTDGVDCSAFVQAVMLESHNKSLPRTTYQQSLLGKEVAYSQAQSGDLVFFKTGRKQRHVGIYLGDNAFMHASTSKGVIISRLDNPYWASVFWQIRTID